MKNPSHPWRKYIKFKRYILVPLAMLIFIVGFFIYIHMGTGNIRGSKGTNSEDLLQAIKNTKIEESTEKQEPGMIFEKTKIIMPGIDGDKEWAFFADKIKYDEKKNNAYLTVVEGTKFNNESMQLQIWAETVKLDFISGKVFFEGNVKVISNKKIKFNTEKAVWDPKKKRFNAEGFVHYEGGTSEIFGSEMEIDSNLETAQIKGKVRFHSKIF